MLDDDLLSIRYINDLLFCERRAALHLNEQIWVDNQFTTEGLLAHKRVDVPKNLRRGDKRNVTGMWLVSHRLGLIGKADLVELRTGENGEMVPYPVDFKRGKKRRWDNFFLSRVTPESLSSILPRRRPNSLPTVSSASRNPRSQAYCSCTPRR